MPRIKWPRFYRPVRPYIHLYSLHFVNMSRLAGARPVLRLEPNNMFLAARTEARHGRQKPVVRPPGLAQAAEDAGRRGFPRCPPDAQDSRGQRLAAWGCQRKGGGLKNRDEASLWPRRAAR